jgi:hypothetical protein
MKTSTRLAILAASMSLCGGGIFIANSGLATKETADVESTETILAADGYQFAATHTPKLTFQQLETIIRGDPIAKAQRGRIEFGSVRMEEGSAIAEVMFISNDDRVTPFLYKLQPERDSWKVVNVQRIWYVPRSHLLRGVRA